MGFASFVIERALLKKKLNKCKCYTKTKYKNGVRSSILAIGG